jgi:hypothetical protein
MFRKGQRVKWNGDLGHWANSGTVIVLRDHQCLTIKWDDNVEETYNADDVLEFIVPLITVGFSVYTDH